MDMKKFILTIGIAALVLGLASCDNGQPLPASDGASNPVSCKAGTFVGKVENGVTKFFGIKFAEDPLDYMFELPVPYVYPEGIHQVTEFANVCPQSDGYHLADISGEDFLSLNIWTVDNRMEKKPVMVFIHGGGWRVGGNREALYDGSVFVKEHPDVMYVTMAYRLGMLGACDLDMFPDGDQYKQSKALCVMDLVCGLQWLKDNIAAFGGDPDNITIMGQSAGGNLVSTLCVSPYAKGLFRNAIPLSGSFRMCAHAEDLTGDNNAAVALAKKYDCKTVAELKKLPKDVIIKECIEGEIAARLHKPIIDGDIIPDVPFDEMLKGFKGNMIMSSIWDDGRIFVDPKEILELMPGDTYEEQIQNLRLFLCDIIETSRSVATEEDRQVIDKYLSHLRDVLGYTDWASAIEFTNDEVFFVPAVKTASEAVRYNCGNVYNLVWESPRFGPRDLRAAHSIDLPFLIGTIKNEGMVEDVTRGEDVDTTGWFALSDRVRNLLVCFMKTGKPTDDETVFRQFDQKHGWTTVVRSADEIFTMPLPKPERVELLWPHERSFFLDAGLGGDITQHGN